MSSYRIGPSVVVWCKRAASVADAIAEVKEKLGDDPDFEVESMIAYTNARHREKQRRIKKKGGFKL